MSENPRLEELRRRVQQDPASISFAALAEEYRRAGLFHDAIETCRAGLQRHPAYLSARVTLGRSLLEVGEYDDAVVELEQVLRAAPENLAAIRALADIHRRRGEIPETMEDYQAAVAATPPTPEPTIASPAPQPAPVPPVHEPVVSAPAAAPAPELTVVAAAVPAPAPVIPPAIAALEQFLWAIMRARRQLAGQAAR
jgi:tetratricopeptide (TPR) repeat protein